MKQRLEQSLRIFFPISLPTSFSMATSLVVALSTSLGCGAGEEREEELGNVETHRALGASTPAYGFSGHGAGPMPTYQERVGMYGLNRVRLAPAAFGVDAFAAPPLRYEPFMAEAGRWQGRHALEEDCFCQQDPEEPGPVRSCCAVGVDEGVVQCLGPRVECEDGEATDREERWALLNQGPGEIRHELYYAGALGHGQEAFNVFAQNPGAFVGPGLTAMALARVENDEGQAEQEYYWTLISGRSTRPASVLTSGIHLQLEGTPFSNSEAGQADFAVVYAESAGPGEVHVVVEGQCEALVAGAAANDPEGLYIGASYTRQLDIFEGCHRYYFAAIDAHGFAHTYPEYGSLGMLVDGDGVVVDNDASCPIWSGERPETSCLPAVTECADGDRRACYTGRDHTAGVGICALGEERCAGGWWSGVCEGEVTAELEERCDDPRDNNCNGLLNEGCPGGGAQPDPDDEEAGDDPPPAAGGDDVGEEGGCGCASLDAGAPMAPRAVLIVGLFALVAAVLRRRV